VTRQPQAKDWLRPCGTTAAHKRHLRHGEEPCEACRKASAQERAGQRKMLKAAGK
jgi:hypothetical protein